MNTFGITGSIACGKSTVSKFIRNQGIPIVDADIVAREVVLPGAPALKDIISSFGEEYLLSDGYLDRTKLANLVFSNDHSMKILNNIMGPAIQKESSYQIKNYHAKGFKLVGYDAALIIESGNADKYRPLIVVSVSEETQLNRLIKRNNLNEQEALKRISKQFSSKEKIKYADFIIDTGGSLEELELKVKETLNQINNYFNIKMCGE